MTDLPADLKCFLKFNLGVEVRSAEHPDDCRQHQRCEDSAFWFTGLIPELLTALLMLSLITSAPGMCVDWAAGLIQLILGGACGFAVKPLS